MTAILGSHPRPRRRRAGPRASARSPRAALRWISPDGPARERRLAGEDLAEDRAQGEDVGPLVDPVDLAAGLLGRHVGRRAQHRCRPARASASEPLRAVRDHASRRPAPAGRRRRRRRRPAARPWPGPSPSPAPRRSCRPSRSTASGRGGSRPGRGRRPSSGRPARRSPGTAAGRRAGSGRSASSAASVRPLTSFMVKYGRRSAKVPSS